MKNYTKKDTRRVLARFDTECLELFYTPYFPEEVKKARKKIEAVKNKGVSAMEIVKERLMIDLSNLLDELYRTGQVNPELAPFDEFGEPIGFESCQNTVEML